MKLIENKHLLERNITALSGQRYPRLKNIIYNIAWLRILHIMVTYSLNGMFLCYGNACYRVLNLL